MTMKPSETIIYGMKFQVNEGVAAAMFKTERGVPYSNGWQSQVNKIEQILYVILLVKRVTTLQGWSRLE